MMRSLPYRINPTDAAELVRAVRSGASLGKREAIGLLFALAILLGTMVLVGREETIPWIALVIAASACLLLGLQALLWVSMCRWLTHHADCRPTAIWDENGF